MVALKTEAVRKSERDKMVDLNKSVKREKVYSVAVVATMSAGKSTILNSLVGERLLPSRNEACTATVCKVEDVDSMETFEGRPKVNGSWQDWHKPVVRDDIDSWNDSKVDEIELRGNLPWINNTADDVKIDMVSINEYVTKNTEMKKLMRLVRIIRPTLTMRRSPRKSLKIRISPL